MSRDSLTFLVGTWQPPGLVTLEEAARRLRTTAWHLRNRIKSVIDDTNYRGFIPRHIGLQGRQKLYEYKDLERFFHGRKCRKH